jgi:hypothetical protein
MKPGKDGASSSLFTILRPEPAAALMPAASPVPQADAALLERLKAVEERLSRVSSSEAERIAVLEREYKEAQKAARIEIESLTKSMDERSRIEESGRMQRRRVVTEYVRRLAELEAREAPSAKKLSDLLRAVQALEAAGHSLESFEENVKRLVEKCLAPRLGEVADAAREVVAVAQASQELLKQFEEAVEPLKHKDSEEKKIPQETPA